jgi:hypothetical protein
MADSPRKLNVFSPGDSRYIKLYAELQACLEEKYAEQHKAGYDFKIQVRDLKKENRKNVEN